METYVYIFLKNTFTPAGLLRSEPGGTAHFAYGRRYLENPSAQPIDPVNLPLSEKEYITEPDFEVFSVVRDAAPDRWGRYLLEKRFNRELTELEYSLASGPQRVGALAFGPDLSGPKILGVGGFEAPTPFHLDLGLVLQASEDLINNEDTERLATLLRYGPSLGGARPKAAVMWDGHSSIAKFGTSLDSRSEARIEFAAMSLARKADLSVPEITLTTIGRRDVYLIRRFDRTANDYPLHFISGLTACGLHERDHHAWSYRGLADAIRRLSSDPERDLRELFKRMVFNILVNNDDDHLRNHGFVKNTLGKWGLSPLYDVVPRDQQSSTFRLALSIGSWGKEASRRNALSAAQFFDLTEAEAASIWSELSEIVSAAWKDSFRAAGLDEKAIERFGPSIGEKSAS